jgi:hypothetical protein
VDLEVGGDDHVGEASRTVHQTTEPPAGATRVRVFRRSSKEGGPTGGEPIVEPRLDLEVARSDLAYETSGGSVVTEPLPLDDIGEFRSRLTEGEPTGEKPIIEPRMESEIVNTARASEANGGFAPPSPPSAPTTSQHVEPQTLSDRPWVFQSRVEGGGPTGGEPIVEPRMDSEVASSGFIGAASVSAPPPQSLPATMHPPTEPPALASGPRVFHGRPKEGSTGREPRVEPPMDLKIAASDLVSEASGGTASTSQPSPPTVHRPIEPPALASRPRVFHSRRKEGGPNGGEPKVEPRMDFAVANRDRASEAAGGSAPPSQPSPPTVHQSTEPSALASHVRVFHSRPKGGGPTSDGA